MSEAQMTTIEVNGVKLEVDLRHAKRVDQLRIGDRVKCLVKSYGGSMETYPGVVIGFEPFPSLPSIQVAYLKTGYGDNMLNFQVFNEETKDFEIIADIDNNALEVDKGNILDKFERDIEKHRRDIEELEQKRDFFVAKFGAYFKDFTAA